MKKIVTVLFILALCSTAVFAAPEASVVSLDQAPADKAPVQALGALVSSPFAVESDLFAGVRGTPLTKEEAQAVEGEGFFGAVFGAGSGGVAGGFIGGLFGIRDYGHSTQSALARDAGGLGGAIVGGILGAIGGAFVPFF